MWGAINMAGGGLSGQLQQEKEPEWWNCHLPAKYQTSCIWYARITQGVSNMAKSMWDQRFSLMTKTVLAHHGLICPSIFSYEHGHCFRKATFILSLSALWPLLYNLSHTLIPWSGVMQHHVGSDCLDGFWYLQHTPCSLITIRMFFPVVGFKHWGHWSTMKEKASVINLNIFC